MQPLARWRNQPSTAAERSLVLFAYDWDAAAFDQLQASHPHDTAGFDLFSFPSNARLATFDMQRWVHGLCSQAQHRGWRAVTSAHEQFGALAAALVAERMGWPGTPVHAVLACQHKLYARQVLQQVAPHANVAHAPLAAEYGHDIPADVGLPYPLFVKPVKAAFSVLARQVANRAELQAHTRFGRWELWVIRHLVEPFEQLCRTRLPQAGSAHRLLLEAPVQDQGVQYNLDGYVWRNEVRPLGFMDAHLYPGTDAFMRFETPSKLSPAARTQALDVAQRFLAAVGYTHGCFNMEFFWNEATQRLTVIEFNPRLASQFSDLYQRTLGISLHRVALELAHGRDPADIRWPAPVAGAAASLVYRSFEPAAARSVHSPSPRLAERAQVQINAAQGTSHGPCMVLGFPKTAGQIERDFKWLRSYRYGIVHLGGRDVADLRRRAEAASACLGWPVPYAESPVPRGALAMGLPSGAALSPSPGDLS